MSKSMLTLKRKITSADDLYSVVRSMKSIAAASINEYEQAIVSLQDYYRTVELGLIASLHGKNTVNLTLPTKLGKIVSSTPPIGVIIFGSDQGLVGQFNESLLSFMHQTLANTTKNTIIWPVGERMRSALTEQTLSVNRSFVLPRQIDSVTSLVTTLLLEIEAQLDLGAISSVYLIFNHPILNTNYEPQMQKLLPLDKDWQQQLILQGWQGTSLPELINGQKQCLVSLIHEYLFVSIFKACVASLASENASRLMAMQRAEKNIEELRDIFSHNYQSQRQATIDEELFDLVSGFEAMRHPKNTKLK